MGHVADHPNAHRITDMVSAFGNGDLDGALAVWAEDAVMHVPGKHVLAGSYRGREEIGGVLVKFAEMSGGSLRLEPLDILADDHHVVAIFRATARLGAKTLDVVDANAFKVDDQGKFSECWWLPDDQPAFDAFWS